MDRNLKHSDLLRLLTYNPDTGVFTQNTHWWKRAPGDPVGSLNKWGYVYVGLLGSQYPAHILAWFYVHGVWPDGAIDHMNRNKSDNRIENLRVVSYSVNVHNSSDNDDRHTVSGVRGVAMISPRNRKRTPKIWRAYIRAHGVQYDLGQFRTRDEAVAIRKGAELLLGVAPHGTTDPCNIVV